MSRKTSKVDTTTTITLTMDESGKMKSAPVQYEVDIPLQLLTPIFADQSSADVERELEEKCKLHTGYLDDSLFPWFTLTSYANVDGIVRAVMTIPDNPVQIIIRRDLEHNIQKIEMINLEDAKPSQIRAVVKYITLLQEKVIGHVRRSTMTQEYNEAYELIMATSPAERAAAKKRVKKEFLARHGKDYSVNFDMAIHRRGYKFHKTQR